MALTIRNAMLRVRRGMRMLDTFDGRAEWRDHVEADSLDLSEGDACVLGQRFGDYNDGLRELGITNEMAEKLGFYIEPSRYAEPDQVEVNYKVLTRAWQLALVANGEMSPEALAADESADPEPYTIER